LSPLSFGALEPYALAAAIFRGLEELHADCGTIGLHQASLMHLMRGLLDLAGIEFDADGRAQQAAVPVA
jgi:hypothetical protein